MPVYDANEVHIPAIVTPVKKALKKETPKKIVKKKK